MYKNELLTNITQYLYFIIFLVIFGIEKVYGFEVFSNNHPFFFTIFKFSGLIVSILIMYETFIDIWNYHQIKKANIQTDSLN